MYVKPVNGNLPTPRTKAAQREATTAALIAAGRALFAERGYAAVGTEEIVQRAGVTRGALYHHFKQGKEELFRAVLVELSAELVRQVVSLAGQAKDPWEELVNGCEAFLDACSRPDVQQIMLVDGPAVLGWNVWREIDSGYALANAVAHVLLGALDEAAMVVARAEDQAEARAEMGKTVRRLLDGLRAPSL
jgi:AcrR family transcriptional regulator